jgi:hypothetical protein
MALLVVEVVLVLLEETGLAHMLLVLLVVLDFAQQLQDKEFFTLAVEAVVEATLHSVV